MGRICPEKNIAIYIQKATNNHSGEAKHSNRSCYANLQLSSTIKTIVNLHSMNCCCAVLSFATA